MNDYLVFDTQAAASTALETIYANMVGAITSTELLNVDTQEVVVKDDLTPAEMVGVNAEARHYPIFGVNAATSEIEVMEGYTTAWAVAQETVGGKWVFSKPSDVLMVGVVGSVVEPFDPAWFPQPLESLTA
jgi:hypothetical protein